MVVRKKRDIGDEAADFGATFVAFMATLGAVIRSAAEWLGLVSMDAISTGADVMGGQAQIIAGMSKKKAKSARKSGRNAFIKLAVVGYFLWWLDRDLSGSER